MTVILSHTTGLPVNHCGQQCSVGALAELDMCVVQILIEAPGKAPFRLTRLGGAPHGQPALALRQVQVDFHCIYACMT
jgi:hypothetical protein